MLQAHILFHQLAAYAERWDGKMASYDNWKTTDPAWNTLGSSPQFGTARLYCLECDSIFDGDEQACPYCGVRNFDIADDEDDGDDGRDFTPPYEP